MWKCACILLLRLCAVESRFFANETELGTIQGMEADDGDYVMFLGIPYAKVNATNPFGSSIPYPKYDNVFKAFDGTVVCPQIDEFSNMYTGTLDCLRLNVYVPNTGSQNKAVVIYIHGGAFRQGNGGKYILGPEYLVRHDVIVVTFNYRLGPYGFLCTNWPELPGNQGIKDQYIAMQWVKNNIHAFGGSPERITLMGHSAGSMCVDMHLLAKRPRLYQQAILQSGAATAPGQLMYPDDAPTLEIARSLGLNATDVSKAVALLASTDPKSVISASESYEYKFCVEKEHKNVFGYITEHPEKSKASNVDGLNILSGVTDNEFLFALYGSAGIDKFNNSNIFRQNLEYVFDLENIEEMAIIVQHFYLGDGQNDFTNRYKVVDYLSDSLFLYPMQRALNKYSQHKNTTVYFYVFSYDGNRNFFKSMYNVTESGAAHADELGYLFHGKIMKTIPTAQDVTMVDKISKLWTNFIKYGNPTPETNALIPVIWPPMVGTNGILRGLQIDKHLQVISRPFHSRMAFWELLYNTHEGRLKTALSTNSSTSNKTYNSFFYIVLNVIYIVYYIFT
ncbi:acetylcholinesterase-like [Aricia agestis]|uniref:acetylcholinesterase-like n=1 Tax=Aricia agestis TaxID=91739 RepID=UPI001C201B3B|nr:acetylcholinesterase-like [Aricia agestis]